MSKPIPSWTELLTDTQKDLSRAKFTQAGFDGQAEENRLTLLNIYVKLCLLNLWNHVRSGQIPRPGVLDFEAVNVAQLKKELTDRNDFGSPESSNESWSSSEKALEAMLHFKHEKKWGHGPVTVQAHIDAVGWSGWDPNSWVDHLSNFSAYKDPYRVRDVILRKFGWQILPGWRQRVVDVLLGINEMHVR